ncbi:WD40 repeat-like protein [Suillus weaverae]|nr:WD40 repeat-like protein [Suillus weaverae]
MERSIQLPVLIRVETRVILEIQSAILHLTGVLFIDRNATTFEALPSTIRHAVQKAPENTACTIDYLAGLFSTTSTISPPSQSLHIIELRITVSASHRHLKTFFISILAESSTSVNRRDGERGATLNSPVVSAPRRTKRKDPPRYGAQHRQDALWEGGNEAFPPNWYQLKSLDGRIEYRDPTLVMGSWNRPLPGVRLDSPQQLISGCEWHISPLGRSYFVNHNTRTTSWKKPTPERPPGSLTPERVIEGHSEVIWSLACLGTSCNILSASRDGSIRQWKRDGKPVGRPWTSDGGEVASIAMSPDKSMVVSGSGDGRLQLWNIKKGSVIGDPWEGHGGAVGCIDWAPNAQEIASGSHDGTIRRWNPDTGRQIAPPIEASHGRVYALRYSPQGDRFTSGAEDMVICVWSKDGELLKEIKGHDGDVMSLCWSKDGAHIFSASYDKTIRKWRSIDGEELIVFQGHTNIVNSLCLSPDENYLVSASSDYSAHIWDLKTNQPVGDPLLHDDEVLAVVISSDGKYIVSGGLDAKIYVWSLDAALKHTGRGHNADESNAQPNAKLKASRLCFPFALYLSALPGTSSSIERCCAIILHASHVSKQQPIKANYGKDFWDADTNPTPHPAASLSSKLRNFLDSLHFSARPSNTPQSIPLESRRWNFNLFPGGSSIPTIEVAAGRKKNRIFVSPPSGAEVARAEAAAAMQRTNGNEAGSSTQGGQPQAVRGTQVSQGRPTETETQGAGSGTGVVSYEVRCCGMFFSCGRPTSHQS